MLGSGHDVMSMRWPLGVVDKAWHHTTMEPLSLSRCAFHMCCNPHFCGIALQCLHVAKLLKKSVTLRGNATQAPALSR